MRTCLPLFLLLFTWLPLWSSQLPEPELLFGLKWGMSEKQVEEALEADDNLLLHGTQFILNSGFREYHCRRYGTYVLLGIPMDMVCGFDRDYTELEMISLRYTATSFHHALGVYEKLAEYLSLKLFGPDRNLRSGERRPIRQDIIMDWMFPQTRFHMRVWGSDSSGEVLVWFSKRDEGQSAPQPPKANPAK